MLMVLLQPKQLLLHLVLLSRTLFQQSVSFDLGLFGLHRPIRSNLLLVVEQPLLHHHLLPPLLEHLLYRQSLLVPLALNPTHLLSGLPQVFLGKERLPALVLEIFSELLVLLLEPLDPFKELVPLCLQRYLPGGEVFFRLAELVELLLKVPVPVLGELLQIPPIPIHHREPHLQLLPLRQRRPGRHQRLRRLRSLHGRKPRIAPAHTLQPRALAPLLMGVAERF
mmetsp:Transcript_38085/g.99639  ORF Transcript_38085/g.99639 Transcript_38085/m.99639 type:complete len:224 (+) Transcript_38085:269-940(+)